MAVSETSTYKTLAETLARHVENDQQQIKDLHRQLAEALFTLNEIADLTDKLASDRDYMRGDYIDDVRELLDV